MNHAIGILKDRLIITLCEEDREKRREMFDEITDMLKKRIIPIRPNRSFPRNIPRKAKFHHNQKSNCWGLNLLTLPKTPKIAQNHSANLFGIVDIWIYKTERIRQINYWEAVVETYMTIEELAAYLKMEEKTIRN